MVVLLSIAVWLAFPRNQGDERPTAAVPARDAGSADPIAHGVEPAVATLSRPAEGKARTRIDALAKKHDARLDDWETEVLNDIAAGQIDALRDLIENPQRIDARNLAGIVSEDFTCAAGGLRPGPLTEVFDDGRIRVRRWVPVDNDAPDESSRGTGAMAQALRELVAALGDGRDIRTKLQLFRIEESEGSFSTTIYYEASNRMADRGVQQNATWRCRWNAAANGPPRLRWIGVQRYEEVQIEAEAGRLFVDCTASAMSRNDAYRQQVLPGLGHWLGRISTLQSMLIFGHHGVAVGDVNGDGLDDLYVCDAGGLPNRLYLQNPDGTVTDFTEQSHADLLELSTAALLVDLDNDGDQDLVAVARPNVLFAENDGTGRFTWRGGHSDVRLIESICAADYDADGFLDIYVCGYGFDQHHIGPKAPIPYHDANNGEANALLRNDGKFRFLNVTESVGLDVNNSRFSFAAAWEDYDNDGDLDLYVANDFGRNNLYRNDGPAAPGGAPRFTDVAAAAGVEDMASGMSVSWGDYNRDGWMDLYVGNMFSAAGNRVLFQRRFIDSGPDHAAHVQRLARGNSLFTNGADGSFQDDSVDAAVFNGRWAWASRFADLNNDGWLDLFVLNGYVTGTDTGDL